MKLLAVAVAGRGLVDPSEPVFRADDEALLRGGAAFETIRVYGGKPFLLARHLERLAHSARALSLPEVGEAEAIAALVVDGAPPDHVLRLYRTEHALVATAAAIPGDLDELRTRGLAVATVDTGPRALPAGVKATSYAEAFAARRATGADDVLFVSDGAVTECATANIWWRRRDTLYTPPTGSGVLPGVTRSFLVELEHPVEGAFPAADLAAADEAFTTSSVREVMPVVSLDGATIGDGLPGPAAARLQAAIRLHSSV